ncbi:hypothetical protein [Paenibacillus larvae]|uniref:Uncharacterized protein n=1 Tax=Paenibacillus larvae subsp. larvae TaxID=147375 RepID=A0A2L1U7A4_9BACL|nr:hypothetical protein [Paenibacillus larvae]AVF28802.1 hypothetical protein ERICIII_04798 [Paenibacillus larvae subsp. larvae]MCY9499064.1 hypothetical protein [Paenibacillus larvae]MCY9745353.1 hypothetical protein [Paenibacillus larvae]MCY9750215.1 hypothetical protein [Paenibacillus larvae]MDR5608818.1 hypothetical protein [Paenibacillus larvae]
MRTKTFFVIISYTIFLILLPLKAYAWYPPDNPAFDEIFISPDDTYQNPVRPKGDLHDEVKGYREEGGGYAIIGYYTGRVHDGEKIEIVSYPNGNYILTIHIVQKPEPTPKPKPLPEKPKETPKPEVKPVPTDPKPEKKKEPKPIPSTTPRTIEENKPNKENIEKNQIKTIEKDGVKVPTKNPEDEVSVPVEPVTVTEEPTSQEDTNPSASSEPEALKETSEEKPLAQAQGSTTSHSPSGWIFVAIGLTATVIIILFSIPKFRIAVRKGIVKVKNRIKKSN